ncbi:hypothetical protein OQJ26_13575 [Legionella sp. PATHC038]|uniref:hypothetical protein n=1 Tax=Legionella sheltonii TaxID=2992041 RepID=UPI0022434389|nr:hypothetical protein [Legionella sp. PATHC038]MCW8399818.1 hypothetical protein [Legionella sp. PATHC038]
MSKIKVKLNNDDINIINSAITHTQDETFKNFPHLVTIEKEGLDKPQWMILKSHIESGPIVVTIRPGKNYGEELDKDSLLNKIDDAIK